MERDDSRRRFLRGLGARLTDSKGQYYFRTIKPISYIRDGRFTKTMGVQIEVDTDESSARRSR